MKAVLVNKTDELGHHGCTLVNRQLEKLAHAAGIEIVSKLPLASDWDALAPRDFDAVIVNGEGTLHGSSRGAKMIAQVPAWAKKRGKPAFLVNSVYQNNSPEIAKAVGEFSAVFVRDQHSAKELAKVGIETTVIPDLTLTWEVEPAPVHGKTVVNGSTLKSVRNELYKLASADVPYLPILARPAEGSHRLRKYRVKRILSWFAMPGVWRARHRNAIPEFDDFAAHLQTQVGGIITGRFHMATMALCLEIPVVVVTSNTHKMDALFESLGMMHRVVSVNDLPRALKFLLPFTAAERQAIRELRAATKELANACFVNIKETTLAHGVTHC